MNKYEKEIRNNFLRCIPLLIIGIVWPVIAYYGLFLPAAEKPEVWFQRSGAITILAAIWIEYNLLKINTLINPVGMIDQNLKDVIPKYKIVFEVSQYLVAVFSICGTIVWGYGDFFLN